MLDWLAERVKTSPHALALIFGEQRWSYAELDGMVNGVCRRLLDAGLCPGERLAVLLPNSPRYVALVHAAARLGVVLVPLNTRLAPAELAWQVEQAEAQMVLVDETVGEELSIINCQLLIVNEAWEEPVPQFTIHNSQFTIHKSQALLFTSGTTGRPKMVPLTFANHFWSATASAFRLGVQPDDLWLSVLPLYHVGGLAVVFRSALYGTAVDLHARFDQDAINAALDTRPITLISLVPTMLHRLLQSRSHWPAGLRLILLGGAAAAPELIERANALPRVNGMRYSVTGKRYPVSGKRYSDGEKPVHSQLTIKNSPLTIPSPSSPLVAPTYGLTEAASQVATMLPQEAARKPGSVGKPLLFTRVKIVDEEGDEVASGQYGEIIVSGPTVMPSYHSPETNRMRAANDTDYATIATGDIGYIDEDGDLWLVQRRSDMIVSGGENVYPAEVEAVLQRHPAVTAACVVGVPDPEWGQRVAAMVAVQLETAVSPAELIDFCRPHLAGYKIPRKIHLVSHLPLTASGKIARQQVQELLTT